MGISKRKKKQRTVKIGNRRTIQEKKSAKMTSMRRRLAEAASEAWVQ